MNSVTLQVVTKSVTLHLGDTDVHYPAHSVTLSGTSVTGPTGPQAQWVALTQAEYDALAAPDANTLYLIVGS